jgi:hypothetical protein
MKGELGTRISKAAAIMGGTTAPKLLPGKAKLLAARNEQQMGSWAASPVMTMD